MSETKGIVQTSVAGTYNSASSPLYTMCRMFVSPALAAQTLIGSQANYMIAIANRESNAKMNMYHRAFVYVWRPGSGNVKTIIAPTSHGTESTTSEVGRIIVATGEATNFSILNNDRIVVELWFDIRNTKGANYTATDYYDGATDPLDGTATSDAASYLRIPQEMIYYTPEKK